MTRPCPCCGLAIDPNAGTSCTVLTYDDFGDGVSYPRVRHESPEEMAALRDWLFEPASTGKPCACCGTPASGLHHPGCDNERCPKCGGQACGCDCHDEEPEDE